MRHADLCIAGDDDEATDALAMLDMAHPDPSRVVELVDSEALAHAFPDGANRPWLAVAPDPAKRRDLVDRIRVSGGRFAQTRAYGPPIAQTVTCGVGSFVGPFVMLGARANIGDHVVISAMCSIGHDVILEEFVTIDAGAVLSGYVHVEHDARIGLGATIVNGTPDRPIRIGAYATIAPGAVVTKSVRAGRHIVGNPGRESVEPG